MNVWILRRLSAETQKWWAHVALRERGDTEEARARECISMRFDLDVIRKTLANPGTYISCGMGGTTIHYARGCRLRSYSPLSSSLRH